MATVIKLIIRGLYKCIAYKFEKRFCASSSAKRYWYVQYAIVIRFNLATIEHTNWHRIDLLCNLKLRDSGCSNTRNSTHTLQFKTQNGVMVTRYHDAVNLHNRYFRSFVHVGDDDWTDEFIFMDFSFLQSIFNLLVPVPKPWNPEKWPWHPLALILLLFPTIFRVISMYK